MAHGLSLNTQHTADPGGLASPSLAWMLVSLQGQNDFL